MGKPPPGCSFPGIQLWRKLLSLLSCTEDAWPGAKQGEEMGVNSPELRSAGDALSPYAGETRGVIEPLERLRCQRSFAALSLSLLLTLAPRGCCYF